VATASRRSESCFSGSEASTQVSLLLEPVRLVITRVSLARPMRVSPPGSTV